MYAEHGKHPREALFYAVSAVVLIVYIIRRHMLSATIMYLFTVKMFLCRKRSSELKKTQFYTLVEQKITKSYPVCPSILHDVFYLVRQMKHFCVVFTWASFSRMVRMRIASDYGYGRKFFIWCDEERARSGRVDKIETNRAHRLHSRVAILIQCQNIVPNQVLSFVLIVCKSGISSPIK